MKHLLALLIALVGLLLFADFAEAKGRSKRKPASEAAALQDVDLPAPQDNETCFSPNQGCDQKLWKFIQTATKSLDVAVYDITHEKIVHEIAVASKKVPTRVIVDRRQSKEPRSLVSTLIKAGVEVRYGSQRGIMHHKFTLVDGLRLETGSFNYSHGASFKNQENQLYLSEKSIVESYKKQFQKMWEASKPAKLDVAKAKG